MRKNIFSAILIMIVLILSAQGYAAPAGFEVKSGWVAYHIDGKMFGFAAHPVDAVNNQISGAVYYVDGKVAGGLKIPVKGFSSGDKALDNNAFNTLKGNENPYITFELMDVNLPDADMENILAAPDSTRKIKGKLTIAGVSKVFDFDIRVKKVKDNEYKLSTTREVKFTDFGITPPSMGAVSVLPDQVFVRGEIIVKKI